MTDPSDKEVEIQHIKHVLSANGYKDWSLEIPNQQDKAARREAKEASNPTTPSSSIGLPYIKGLSEELQRIYHHHGVGVYHKPYNTIRSLLVHPKDKTDKKDKCGVVYNVPCGAPQCTDSYVGETQRKLGKRFHEHIKTDKESAVLEHHKKTGHSVSFEDVSILATENRYNNRKIKEALEIYKRKPTLNRDQGWEIDPVLLQLLTPLQDLNTTTGPGWIGTRNRTNSI